MNKDGKAISHQLPVEVAHLFLQLNISRIHN